MPKLYDALCAYDGKAITLLSEAQAKHGKTPTFLTELVALAASENSRVSEGATWLIKANLEKGIRLTPDQTQNLVENLKKVTTWQAQLHTCHSFEYFDIPVDQASSVADWLIPLLQHQRPFLRAWSMNAFQILAAQHKKYLKQAKAALTDAEKDPAASVRARARNVSKK